MPCPMCCVQSLIHLTLGKLQTCLYGASVIILYYTMLYRKYFPACIHVMFIFLCPVFIVILYIEVVASTLCCQGQGVEYSIMLYTNNIVYLPQSSIFLKSCVLQYCISRHLFIKFEKKNQSIYICKAILVVIQIYVYVSFFNT